VALCGTGEVHTDFGLGDMERDHLGDLGVDGRTLFNLTFKKVVWGFVDCIALSQDRDR